MRAKHKEREEAISLRKSGLTYSEIRRQLNVSPSSLSNWLKHIALTTSQQERIAQLQEIKRVEGITKHKEKVARSSTQIKARAATEITPLSAKELLLVGTALYWAEGSKQTKKSISQGLIFNNSDAKMIQLYLSLAYEDTPNKARRDSYRDLYSHKSNPPQISNY